MTEQIKFIKDFFVYDKEIKQTVEFLKGSIMDKDSKYFEFTIKNFKGFFIELKVVKEEIVEEKVEEKKFYKKTKNKEEK